MAPKDEIELDGPDSVDSIYRGTPFNRSWFDQNADSVARVDQPIQSRQLGGSRGRLRQSGGRATMPLKYFNQTAGGKGGGCIHTRQTGGRVTMPLKYFNQTAAGRRRQSGGESQLRYRNQNDAPPKSKPIIRLKTPRQSGGNCGMRAPRQTGGNCGMRAPRQTGGNCGMRAPRQTGGNCGMRTPTQKGGNCGMRTPTQKGGRVTMPLKYFNQTAAGCPFARGSDQEGGNAYGAPFHIPRHGVNSTLNQTVHHASQMGGNARGAPFHLTQFGKGKRAKKATTPQFGGEFKTLYGTNVPTFNRITGGRRQTGGVFRSLYGSNQPTFNYV